MLVENLSEKTKNTVSFVTRRLLPAAMFVTSLGCNYIERNQTSEPTINQLQESCTSSLLLSAHYFKYKSGLTDANGNPKFQPGADEIIGSVVGRRYLVTIVGGFSSGILITGEDGTVDRVVSEFGVESLGNSSVPLLGKTFVDDQGLRRMRVIIEGLESEKTKEYYLPCDSTVEIDVKVPKNMKNFDDFPDELKIK